MIVAMNIGYGVGSKVGHSGVLSYQPMIFTFKTVKQLTDLIRESTDVFFEWAEEHHVIPSELNLFLSIGLEVRPITIRLINVREYRAKWEKKYGKPYTHSYGKPIKMYSVPSKENLESPKNTQ